MILPAQKEKIPEINDFRGFVVDKRFEISNLELTRSIIGIITLMEFSMAE